MSKGYPPLNWLRAFEAAARRGSFAAAAEELRVTPSAVSQHVRALESRLARPLFDRRPNGVALTPAGRRYAEELGRAFASIDKATASLLDRGVRALLIIRVATSFASQWIAPRLDLFRTAYPEIDLRLTALGPGVEQARGAVDAEIRYGWGGWPGLDTVQVLREEIFPVCSPKLASRIATPEDLGRFDLLHVPGYAQDWDEWLALAGAAGIDTGAGSSFDQSIMAIRAAVEGKGVMLGRSSLIGRELAAGLLVAPFAPRLKSTGAYWFLTTREGSQAPKVGAFREWLLEEARSAPSG